MAAQIAVLPRIIIDLLILSLIQEFDSLRIGSFVVCGGVCYCNVLIIILMD
jgi:hypothetical protein